MQCDQVTDRLVAYSDGELSRGEHTFVAEHLATCEACARLDEALRAATPEDVLVIPPDVLARMHAAVDEAIASADLSPPVARPSSLTRWTRWLRRDRDMSNGAVLAYGMLLAACLGWGLSNWLAVQGLQHEPARTASMPTVQPTSDAPIPGDQYRPASFSPDDDAGPWR